MCQHMEAAVQKMSRSWFIILIYTDIANTQSCVWNMRKLSPSWPGQWVTGRQKCRNLEHGAVSNCNLSSWLLVFTFCSNYVIYLSTKPLQEFCCLAAVEQNAFTKLLFLFTQLYRSAFSDLWGVPLEMLFLHWNMCCITPALRNVEQSVFSFPDEGTAFLSMGAAWKEEFQSRNCMAGCVLLVHER